MASHIVWVLAFFAAISCPTNAEYLGQQVSISDAPSLAQIEFRVGVMWVQQCVCNVLTSVHILTPATCFSGDLYNRENRRVRAGASKRSKDGVVIEVGTAYNHPNFGTLGSDGDISVVRLASYLPLGDNIKQVSILGEGIYLPTGLTVELFGWGTTAQGGETSNPDLYKLTLYTQNNERCLETYFGLDEPKIITENMVCVGLLAGGRSFDSRDIGAPVFYQNVLIGQSIFGDSSDGDEIPIVTIATASYTNWIIETAI